MYQLDLQCNSLIDFYFLMRGRFFVEHLFRQKKKKHTILQIIQIIQIFYKFNLYLKVFKNNKIILVKTSK